MSIASPDREGASPRPTVIVRGQATIRAEPETAGRPAGSGVLSNTPDRGDMSIDVEEDEVRATIDATFALSVGDDGREGQRPPSPGTVTPRPKASRRRQSRS